MSTGMKLGIGFFVLLMCLGFILFGLSMAGVIGGDSSASPAPAKADSPATASGSPPPPRVITYDQKTKILAVGTDGNIYTAPAVASPMAWEQRTSSGGIIDVSQLNDGTFACVNSLGKLYTSPTIVSPVWTEMAVPSGTLFASISQMTDGTFIALNNKDKFVWKTASLTSPTWAQVPGACCGNFAARQLADGSVALLGGDSFVYKTNSLTPVSWEKDAASCCGIGLAQLADGQIAVVGGDHQIYTKKWGAQFSWNAIAGSGSIISISTYA
jgi:hypothetical protein